jgi:SNF2 family DNA or RNA helicase
MQAYYRRVVDELLESRQDLRETEQAFIKMRQIASGFLNFVDREGNKVQMDFKSNPKMEALMELIGEMPTTSKAIVFYEFTHSGERICEELKKKKIKHGWLWSGTKNWPEIKEAFDTDPTFKVLVIQHRKGSMGLNLQAGDYDFFYESPISPLDREEAERRNWRTGQKKHVMSYDIVVRDSVEELILGYHKEGNNIFEALISKPDKVLQAA